MNGRACIRACITDEWTRSGVHWRTLICDVGACVMAVCGRRHATAGPAQKATRGSEERRTGYEIGQPTYAVNLDRCDSQRTRRNRPRADAEEIFRPASRGDTPMRTQCDGAVTGVGVRRNGAAAQQPAAMDRPMRQARGRHCRRRAPLPEAQRVRGGCRVRSVEGRKAGTADAEAVCATARARWQRDGRRCRGDTT
ncbi:hypothetical protein FA95DRAFT_403292 [Auriscalpium vulgare]|uniref:Uncharacterized protein n=1 Tax=Auriscalpium vulgare TaxID=40419 RepID=A0ACB8RH24_9AGAM|nr:hypothetical protein FA95DRAFT_403292 [Auriscalpium vulgare]